MGIVFGITGAPEPSYQLLRVLSQGSRVPFEIRYYQPFFIAEVPMNEGEDNSGFGVLARYLQHAYCSITF